MADADNRIDLNLARGSMITRCVERKPSENVVRKIDREDLPRTFPEAQFPEQAHEDWPRRSRYG
jgi:hypothetical protein